VRRRPSFLTPATWCGGGGAPTAASRAVTPDDGGQESKAVDGQETTGATRSSDLLTSGGVRFGKAGRDGHGPDLGADGPAWAMVSVLAVSDSSAAATRRGLWVRPASRGHLGLRSRAWWWWPTLPSELVGRLDKGG
jgi:hypothetical protein